MTKEQASEAWTAERKKENHKKFTVNYIDVRHAFEAGADWQHERFTQLIDAAREWQATHIDIQDSDITTKEQFIEITQRRKAARLALSSALKNIEK